MTYSETLQPKIAQFEWHLDSYFSEGCASKKKIDDAMLYSLKAGGKRIRPLLMLEVAQAYGASYEAVLPFAAALEMIHTYSLVHDDLPCMDDDDMRRGKPTNHKVYGEAMAVLAGDGLLNSAFELMICAALSAPETLPAVQTIAEAAGTQGMILGQVADIHNTQNPDQTVETLDYINTHKTGKLIMAALIAGAQLAGAEEDVPKMREIGRLMGLMFQMKDDCLDIVGEASALGKAVNNDLKNDKLTYPHLMGIEATEAAIKALEADVLKLIDTCEVPHAFLRDTVDFFVNRKY